MENKELLDLIQKFEKRAMEYIDFINIKYETYRYLGINSSPTTTKILTVSVNGYGDYDFVDVNTDFLLSSEEVWKTDITDAIAFNKAEKEKIKREEELAKIKKIEEQELKTLAKLKEKYKDRV